MTTLVDLQTAHAEAVATYNAALQALYAAYVGLAALDGAIASAQAGGGPLRSFGGSLDDVRATVLHAHPLVAPPSGVPISTQIEAARNALVAQVTG